MAIPNIRNFFVIILSGLILLLPCPCFSKTRDSLVQSPSPDVENPNDRSSIFSTGSLLAGGIFAVGMAMQFDDDVRHEMQFNDELRNQPLANIGNAWAEGGGALVVAGIYGLGWYEGRSDWKKTSEVMIWSSLISSTVTRVGKLTGGRLRPYQTDTSHHWLTGGGSSFPSGHTTQAFALSTAYAESVPNPSWKRRLLAYTLATSTAYARMHDDKHWLSDTVAGALVGSVSALLTIKYDLAEKGMQLIFEPGEDGGVGVKATKTF